MDRYAYVAYKHEDLNRIKPYLNELQKQNIDFWFDEKLVAAQEWADQLAKKLEKAHCMLLFLSSRSINSKYVKREINFAVKKDIPIICVYLENVHLQGGMLLQLDVDQAIFLNKYETVEDGTKRIAEAFHDCHNSKFIFRKKENSGRFDAYKIYLWTLVLSVIGILVQAVISKPIAVHEKLAENYYLERQIFGMIIGIVTMYIGLKVSMKRWSQVTVWFHLAALALTFLLLTPFGTLSHGITRVLNIGLFSFVPTCWVIVGHILLIGAIAKKRMMYLLWPITAVNFFVAIYVGKYVYVALVILCITFIVGFVIGERYTKYILLTFLCMFSVRLTTMESYSWKRIVTWLDPYSDPMGVGYPIIQRLEAIQRGGPFGNKEGVISCEEFLLPQAISENVWACILEAFGWIAGLVIVGMYVLLFLEMIKIVRDALDSKMRFGTIAATGITVHFAFVVIYNIACSFNLLPIISDIGYLPFLSFGNMNLIHWLEIGIIASIKKCSK